MKIVPDGLRPFVWSRAAYRCEYCLIPDGVGLVPHQPDHILAMQHGGTTIVENLALACFECNRRKGANIASRDPRTRRKVFLFDPRRHKWSDHFKLEDARIVGLTPVGRATEALLKLNLTQRLHMREELIQDGRYASSAPP